MLTSLNTNLVWTKTEGVGWFLFRLMLGTFFFFLLAGSDFCANRKSGSYPDPDDCAGFIVCNNDKAHRQKCALPLLFRADTMNCDLPERVDCGTRPRRHDLAQGFYLTDTPLAHHSSYMKTVSPGANQGKD